LEFRWRDRYLEEHGYALHVALLVKRLDEAHRPKGREEALYPSDHPFGLVRTTTTGREELPLRHEHGLQAQDGAQVIQAKVGRQDLLQREHRLPREDDVEGLYGEAPLLRGGDLHLQRPVRLQRTPAESRDRPQGKISVLLLMFSAPTLPDHQRAEEDDNG
jgi:hypothetical protein